MSNHECAQRPEHVAIIMDGNGRWATERAQHRCFGHVEGARAATRAYQAAQQHGIRQLTLYSFSSANFGRPSQEVATIMALIAEYAERQRDDFLARGIRFEVVGDLARAPTATQEQLAATIEATAEQDAMVLSLAVAYGARDDLVRAVRALTAEARDGAIDPARIDVEDLRRHMWTSRIPDVDLLIRTGGEQRLSDFLLLESAYSELFFDAVMWPDFDSPHLERALEWFATRERRFGDVVATGTAA